MGRRDYDETRYCEKCKATARWVILGGYHFCMGVDGKGCLGAKDGPDKGKVVHDKGRDEP